MCIKYRNVNWGELKIIAINRKIFHLPYSLHLSQTTSGLFSRQRLEFDQQFHQQSPVEDSSQEPILKLLVIIKNIVH